DFYPRKFGSRTTPEAQGSLLATNVGAALRNDPDGHRDDWIIFAAPGASSFAAQSPQPAASPQASRPSAEERPMPVELPEPAPAPPAAAGSSADVTPAAEQGPPDIEQRLETLKRLREKDLISEEIYREK